MKKVMWSISALSLVMSIAALQFLPDTVPMHYTITGEIDRWGSKFETLIFPAIILAFSLFWHLFISFFEKKAANAVEEKETAEARSNAKVMKIAGVSTAAMLTILQGFILYGAYKTVSTGTAHAQIDFGKISCILCGVVLLILGNFMPKARRNRWVGVRVRWSMYNDVTWMKSNRFGGVALIAAGLGSILTALCAKGLPALIMLLAYLLIAIISTLVYSYKVYRRESSSEKAI